LAQDLATFHVRVPLPNLKFKLRLKFLLQVGQRTLMGDDEVFQLLILQLNLGLHFSFVLIVNPAGFLKLG
jgi:hypothetical protein